MWNLKKKKKSVGIYFTLPQSKDLFVTYITGTRFHFQEPLS